MTALHIASFHSNLELVKFLVEEKNADINIRTSEHEFYYPIGRLIKGNSSAIDFSIDNLDLDMTIYFLELGLKMPKVNTIFIGETTGKGFCEQLCDYFRTKVEQDPSFDNILKQVENVQEDFYENTLAPLIGHFAKECFNEKIELVVEKEENNNATYLIGEENV